VVLALVLSACFEDAGGSELGSGSGADSSGDGDGDDGDADCPSRSSCAASLPDGWDGPVARFLGDDGSLPNCGGDYPTVALEGYAGLDAAPAQCGECACAAVTGVECRGPNLRFYANAQCTGAPALQFDVGDDDECVEFGLFGIDVDGMASDPVLAKPGTGGCAASGGEPELPAIAWATHMRACSAATTGACGDAGSCVPTPGTPFAPGLCIYRAGNHACPVGAYSQRDVYQRGVEDTRDCSACGCGDPSGVACQARIEAHYDAACNSLRGTLDDPGNECVDIDGSGYAPRSGKMIVEGIDGGSCPTTGGAPLGSASPIDPITFCCTP
jgi:hypothetical protein